MLKKVISNSDFFVLVLRYDYENKYIVFDDSCTLCSLGTSIVISYHYQFFNSE